jgi:serine protease AprX
VEPQSQRARGGKPASGEITLTTGSSRLTCLAAAVALLGAPLASMPASSDNSADTTAIIVQAPGAVSTAASAVERAGGTVTHSLPIVSGFAATVPAQAVDDIAAVAGVRAVTRDTALRPAGRPPRPAAVKSVYRTEIGADSLAAGGNDGAGVRVALVDTGIDTAVAATGDLAGHVVSVADPVSPAAPSVPCVNFSGEASCDDTFGHGTFLAGLIAGSGATSGGRYTGVAPGAQIVSVKVGGADGSADVSKVLAGIQWVVSFAQMYDIRVLNLSLGTDSTVPPSVDPLNLAVRRAWVEGLTVVVSAGNLGGGQREGTTYGTVTKPGDDPFVITVGSVDDVETTKISDDRLPAFSSWGPTAHGEPKPDVVAPGARLVSLRAPGSTVDNLPGTVDATYRRGSGTSMSAAVVSGLAAQLLQARPSWRPDDVKAALKAGAKPVASNDVRAVGAGLVNGPAALKARIAPIHRPLPISSGLGTLAGSTGTNLVQFANCTLGFELCLVDLEETSQGNNWQGNNWQGLAYASTQWTPQTWYESQWVVDVTGNNWQGNNWQMTTWAEGNNWQGNNWQGSSWYGASDNKSYGETTPGSGSYGAWGP